MCFYSRAILNQNSLNNLMLILIRNLLSNTSFFYFFFFPLCQSFSFSTFHIVMSSLRSLQSQPLVILSYCLFGHVVKFHFLIISHALSSIIASLYRVALAKAKLNLFFFNTLSEVRLCPEKQGSPAHHTLLSFSQP